MDALMVITIIQRAAPRVDHDAVHRADIIARRAADQRRHPSPQVDR